MVLEFVESQTTVGIMKVANQPEKHSSDSEDMDHATCNYSTQGHTVCI